MRGRLFSPLSSWALTMSAARPTPRRSEAQPASSLSPSRDLAGWADDDHGAAFAAFLPSLPGARGPAPPIAPGAGTAGRILTAVCRGGAHDASISAPSEARRFFETHFQPMSRSSPPCGRRFSHRLLRARIPTARARPTATYRVPSARPAGRSRHRAAGRQACRVWIRLCRPAGERAAAYEPYPDRAAIEDGALGSRATPIVYLREPGEAFIIHVQGSARIRLADGSRDAGRLCGPQRPSLHVHRPAARAAGRDGPGDHDARASDGLAAGPSGAGARR